MHTPLCSFRSARKHARAENERKNESVPPAKAADGKAYGTRAVVQERHSPEERKNARHIPRAMYENTPSTAARSRRALLGFKFCIARQNDKTARLTDGFVI